MENVGNKYFLLKCRGVILETGDLENKGAEKAGPQSRSNEEAHLFLGAAQDGVVGKQ